MASLQTFRLRNVMLLAIPNRLPFNMVPLLRLTSKSVLIEYFWAGVKNKWKLSMFTESTLTWAAFNESPGIMV